MLTFNKQPGQRFLELGGGANRHPQSDVNVDVRSIQGVDFTWDFSQPHAGQIGLGEWDAVLCFYCLEHLPFRRVPEFLKECLSFLKPGGDLALTIPNTAQQMNWIDDHLDGWDGKDLFEAASELLYGSQDYEANTHKVYLSPTIIIRLLEGAGFRGVLAQPWGERKTDLLVHAEKPKVELPQVSGPVINPPPEVEDNRMLQFHQDQVRRYELIRKMNHHGLTETERQELDKLQEQSLAHIREKFPAPPPVLTRDLLEEIEGRNPPVQEEMVEAEKGTVRPFWVGENDPRAKEKESLVTVQTGVVREDGARQVLVMERERLFDKHYFNGGGKVGGYAREGYWDYPVHEVTFRHVMARKPQSVLELGCARGYILKRLEDAGITAQGLEISKHCYLTRVAERVTVTDLCKTPWDLEMGAQFKDSVFDLCFSVATLEHVPEQFLPAVIKEMARTCKRGLHGVDFGQHDDGFDKTHCTLKPKDWWEGQFKAHAPGWPVEIVDKEELERGNLPEEVIRGDGKLKLNIGSFTTMHHHGWTNVDIHDLAAFAQTFNYGFLKCDVRQGLPYGTGVVDLIMCCHMLEHLTYKEGATFLKECRRVLRPTGAMRIIVPDAELLMACYKGQYTTGESTPHQLSDFDEINDGCAASPTPAGKLWALLHEGHSACYDEETLVGMLGEAGFIAAATGFRRLPSAHEKFAGLNMNPVFDNLRQIRRETLDMLPCLSLYVDATPKLS